MERRKHFWNSRWGRIGRKDILVFEDGGQWMVEARDGGSEGASRWFEFGDEESAVDAVRRLMDDSDGWRDLSGLIGKPGGNP